MKKKKQPQPSKTYPAYLIRDLAIWDFSGDGELISHHANELAKAIWAVYNMNNFGPQSFGLSNEEQDDI